MVENHDSMLSVSRMLKCSYMFGKALLGSCYSPYYCFLSLVPLRIPYPHFLSPSTIPEHCFRILSSFIPYTPSQYCPIHVLYFSSTSPILHPSSPALPNSSHHLHPPLTTPPFHTFLLISPVLNHPNMATHQLLTIKSYLSTRPLSYTNALLSRVFTVSGLGL